MKKPRPEKESDLLAMTQQARDPMSPDAWPFLSCCHCQWEKNPWPAPCASDPQSSAVAAAPRPALLEAYLPDYEDNCSTNTMIMIQWNNLCKAHSQTFCILQGSNNYNYYYCCCYWYFNILFSHLSFKTGRHPRFLPLHYPFFPVCQYILLILFSLF